MPVIQVDGLVSCGRLFDREYLVMEHADDKEVAHDAYDAVAHIDGLIDKEQITSPELLDTLISFLQGRGWTVSKTSAVSEGFISHFVDLNH
jgi:hypothetical protein